MHMYDWLLNVMNSLACGRLAKEGEKKITPLSLAGENRNGASCVNLRHFHLFGNRRVNAGEITRICAAHTSVSQPHDTAETAGD